MCYTLADDDYAMLKGCMLDEKKRPLTAELTNYPYRFHLFSSGMLFILLGFGLVQQESSVLV